mgnify:CR=1 FL=1
MEQNLRHVVAFSLLILSTTAQEQKISQDSGFNAGNATFKGTGTGAAFWPSLAAKMPRLWRRTAIAGNLPRTARAAPGGTSRDVLIFDVINKKLMRQRRKGESYAQNRRTVFLVVCLYQENCKTSRFTPRHTRSSGIKINFGS